MQFIQSGYFYSASSSPLLLRGNVPSKLYAYTGRETSAHMKTQSAQQNFPSKMVFAHIIFILHRRVLVNVAQKKFYAHPNFRKLEGTLLRGAPDTAWIPCRSFTPKNHSN